MAISTGIDHLTALRRKADGNASVDVSDFIASLAERGWSAEQLHKNELPIDPLSPGEDADAYAKFWRTIDAIAVELRALDLDPIFIKSIRRYDRYWDSNADFVVPRARWNDVVERLTASSWLMPSRSSRAEQKVIERAKLKMPARSKDLWAAHMYAAVSWRYQSDMGIIRTPDGHADETRLERVDPAPRMGAPASGWVYHPDDVTELVLLGAHVAFENYRITLGEAVNIVLRAENGPAVARALDLAREYGCARALELLIDRSIWIVEHLGELQPNDFPYRLKAAELWPCFAERAVHLARARRPVAAANELTSSIGLHAALWVVRRARRIRRGHEDFRWKGTRRT